MRRLLKLDRLSKSSSWLEASGHVAKELLLRDWALLLYGGTPSSCDDSKPACQEENVLHTHDMECIGSLTCDNKQVQKPARFVCIIGLFLATRACVCMEAEQSARHELLFVLTDVSNNCRLTCDSRETQTEQRRDLDSDTL